MWICLAIYSGPPENLRRILVTTFRSKELLPVSLLPICPLPVTWRLLMTLTFTVTHIGRGVKSAEELCGNQIRIVGEWRKNKNIHLRLTLLAKYIKRSPSKVRPSVGLVTLLPLLS